MHEGVSDKRIDAILLTFKNIELAIEEVARLKNDGLDNIGAQVLASDENGFEIKTAVRSYVTVRHGATLVLLNTAGEADAMKTIASRIRQADW